jgi:hypothetical protein
MEPNPRKLNCTKKQLDFKKRSHVALDAPNSIGAEKADAQKNQTIYTRAGVKIR